MKKYEPFYSSYKRISYDDYKSDKLTNICDIKKEYEKALDAGFDLIQITNFVKQSNGLYRGIKKNYHFKNNKWKIIN